MFVTVFGRGSFTVIEKFILVHKIRCTSRYCNAARIDYVGVRLKSDMMNLSASCERSLYKCSNLYLTKVIFCRVSNSEDARNGETPDNKI